MLPNEVVTRLAERLRALDDRVLGRPIPDDRSATRGEAGHTGYVRFWGWPLLLLVVSTAAVVGVLAAFGQLGSATRGCIDTGKGTCNPNWIYNVLFPALVLTGLGLGVLWRLDRWPAKLARRQHDDR